jgi:putative inorganic carbon (hco3(-)) transporter
VTTLAVRRPRVGPRDKREPGAIARTGWSFEWYYFLFVMVGWCFTPLLRRLIDWHNGFFNPVQITSTIPFLLTIPLALVALRRERLTRIHPALRLFAWIWIATFGYGLTVAVLAGNTSAGLYEAVQYLVPMIAGLWLAGTDVGDTELTRRVYAIVLPLAAVIAVYGIVQFVMPPAWDVLWIEGGSFTSMGDAVPFGLRIFSTLNSTGPAADFFAVCILLALPLCTARHVWVWPVIAVFGAVLLLTLVREAWVGLIVGAAVYLFTSPWRWRVLPFLVVFGILFSSLVSSLPALLGAGQNSDVITARIATLGDVSHDDSALARSGEIQNSLEQGLANPIGRGLGQVGSSSALSANPSSASGNVLDSGYMARLLELGWLGFAGYLFVVLGTFAVMVFGMMRPHRAGGRPEEPARRVQVAVAAAICATLIWGDAAGDAHFGLDGLLFWIAIGLGLHHATRAGSSPSDRGSRTRSPYLARKRAAANGL